MPTPSSKPRTRPPLLSSDHTALLLALNAHKVRYLVVGGYAVGFHSEPRATMDLDIYIRSDEDNSKAVFEALATFGAPLAGYSSADFSDGQSWFQMGNPPERVDVLQKINGVTFDECWEHRIEAAFSASLSVPMISADHLVRKKLAAGRPRDLLDVADIQAASASRQPEQP